jgi:hypothetical protein
LSRAELETTIIEYTRRYAAALKDFDITPPLAVFVSLIDMHGKTLLRGPFVMGAFPDDLPSATLNRARLPFGGCVFDSVPTESAECAKVLKSVLDHLANAAGLAASPLFDAAGQYIGR